MSDLAEAVLLSRPNCTRLVDRMVGAGLVERLPDPSDARVRWAQLTPEGRHRFRRAAPTHLAGIQFHLGQHLDAATAATIGAALAEHYGDDDTALRSYSARALERQWKVQQFSEYMTDLLHVPGAAVPADEREFRYRSRLGRLRYVGGSRYAQQSIAEQYTGLAIR